MRRAEKRSESPYNEVNTINLTVQGYIITKNCINLLTKPDGVGLIGGISVDGERAAAKYLEYVIGQHQKRTPGIEVVGRYNGLKTEITFRNQDRNYLLPHCSNGARCLAVVPGNSR